MNLNDLSSCSTMTKSPVWGVMDVLQWKLVPDKWGGGVVYIQKFKDSWVIHNRKFIKFSAAEFKLPAELLTGVCWIEVGGDPHFIDNVAFEVRAFDWSGPAYIDRYMTLTSSPEKTSFGFVSMQLRTAAKTLGLDVTKMKTTDLRRLAACLEKDSYNISLVARHLRELADYDKRPSQLSMDGIRIVGARYNRGIIPTLAEIKRNTRYGDFIVKHWSRFNKLVSY